MELPKDISSCHALIKVLLIKLELFEKRIEEQNIQLKKQEARIKELEERLNKNSKNSHKPPSSEGYSKKPAFPRSKNKKRGGQPNHKGKTLEMVSKADDSVFLPIADSCDECGQDLSNLEKQVKEIRQVFDLPTPKLEVIEQIQLEVICPCGKVHCSTFPPTVQAPTQYGSGVRALTTLLNNEYNLSVNKIKQLFTDLYGYQINESTIQSNNIRCFDNLESTESLIKEAIIDSEVSHYDESGIRVAGKLHWLHVACTTLFTFFFVHPKRGKKAMKAANILTQTKGWTVHDCLPSYFNFKSGKHALCGAHLLRELNALDEKDSKWAKLFINLLLELYELTDKGQSQLSEADQKQARQIYEQVCQYADRFEPIPLKDPKKRGRPKATKGRNLLNRLMENKEAVLAFAFQQNVPFTNNLAERAIRPVKTKQKVAGCLRTLKGAQWYARIRGFIDTTRKHNRNVFNELKNIFEGKSFLIDRKMT